MLMRILDGTVSVKKPFQAYNPDLIRKRYSYAEWEYLVNIYLEGNMWHFFRALHGHLDRKRVFQYARSAIWSQESLNQVLKDRDFEYDKDFFKWIKQHRRSNNGA